MIPDLVAFKEFKDTKDVGDMAAGANMVVTIELPNDFLMLGIPKLSVTAGIDINAYWLVDGGIAIKISNNGANAVNGVTLTCECYGVSKL